MSCNQRTELYRPIAWQTYMGLSVYVPVLILATVKGYVHYSHSGNCKGLCTLYIRNQVLTMILFIIAGITNTIGRIVAGFFADNNRVVTLRMHNAALIAAGISCLANKFCTDYLTMHIFAAVFGLCVGQSRGCLFL